MVCPTWQEMKVETESNQALGSDFVEMWEVKKFNAMRKQLSTEWGNEAWHSFNNGRRVGVITLSIGLKNIKISCNV